jgi:hypothetical protein
MNLNYNLANIEKFVVLFSFFSFIFLWGIKLEYLQFRLFIFLPLLLIVYQSLKNRNFRFLVFPLLFFACLVVHIILVWYFNDIFHISTLIYANFAGLIAIVISYYRVLISKNLHHIVAIFIYITPIIIIINFFISWNYASLEGGGKGSLMLSDLLFNCDRSAISFGKFIFKENSHFSIVSLPIILSLVFFKRQFFTKINVFFSIIFFVINFLFFSTTFLVSLVACSFYLIIYLLIDSSIEKRFRKVLILTSIIILSCTFSLLPSCKKKIYETVYLITKIENEVIIEKTSGTDLNASSSTFYYSLLVAYDSLKKFNFIGTGINNYEIAHESAAQDLSWYIDRDGDRKVHDYAASVNKKDGYSNFVKLISEFGLLSLILIPCFIKFLFSDKISIFNKVFFSSLIITQLLRGVGYFNGGFIFAIIFYLIVTFSKEN